MSQTNRHTGSDVTKVALKGNNPLPVSSLFFRVSRSYTPFSDFRLSGTSAIDGSRVSALYSPFANSILGAFNMDVHGRMTLT